MYEHLLAELAREDQIKFRNFQQVDLEICKKLFKRVGLVSVLSGLSGGSLSTVGVIIVQS